MDSFPEDQKRLLIAGIGAIPLAYCFKFIHNRTLRILYSLIVGVIIQIQLFGIGFLHLLFACLFVLLIVKFGNRKKVGLYTTIYSLSHLSIIHIHRMIYDYGGWTLDISAIFMMTVGKFIAFGYCFSDGDEDPSQLNQFRAKLLIKDFSLIDFFSYIHFFPACIIGPFFEFKDFIDFIEEKDSYKQIPNTILLTLKRILQAIFFAIIYVNLLQYAEIESLLDSSFNGNFLKNPIFIFLLLSCHKYKYYLGFLFSEACVIASGITYQIKPNGEKNFDRIKTMNVYETETATSIKSFFQNWNISTHMWLKKYIYLRVYSENELKSSKSKQMKANSLTFVISAFWHGFYPSYYFVFFHCGFGALVEENLSSFVKKFGFVNNKLVKIVVKVINIFIIQVGLLYLLGSLVSLTIELNLRYLSFVGYFFTKILFLIFLVELSLRKLLTLIGRNQNQEKNK